MRLCVCLCDPTPQSRCVGSACSFPCSPPLHTVSSSMFVAGFPEYTQPMIDHLVTRKISHWDG